MKTIVSLEITEELKEKLRVEAFNKRLTMSALIRQILGEYFNEQCNSQGTSNRTPTVN